MIVITKRRVSMPNLTSGQKMLSCCPKNSTVYIPIIVTCVHMSLYLLLCIHVYNVCVCVCRFQEWYLRAVEAVQSQLVGHSFPSNLTFVGSRYSPADPLMATMEHLACFFPGVLALGTHHGLPQEHLALARELGRTCYQMYASTRTRLSPESVQFNTAPGGDKRDIVVSYIVVLSVFKRRMVMTFPLSSFHPSLSLSHSLFIILSHF